jgi:hypothetical protein
VSLNADNVYTFTTGFIEVTFTSSWFIQKRGFTATWSVFCIGTHTVFQWV